MPEYGNSIGTKFFQNGLPMQYPGNTIVAEIQMNCYTSRLLKDLADELKRTIRQDMQIMLPPESYHMTVIQGLNDKNRQLDYWPKVLAIDSSMKTVDDYVERCFQSIPQLRNIRMRFREIAIDDNDYRVYLLPENKNEEKRLREYRNQFADEIGFRLPGHDEYQFHITLSYTRLILRDNDKDKINKFTCAVNAKLQQESPFVLPSAGLRFYETMLLFSPTRIPRS